MKQTLISKLLQPLVMRSLYDLHPELLERVPMLRISSEDETGAPTSDFVQAAGYYSNYMWLQKAVNVLANNIAPLRLVVTRSAKTDTEYLETHPIIELLDNPNQDMSSEDLSRQWVIEMMLGGEIGFEVVRAASGNKILELFPRQSKDIIIRAESTRYRRVASYKIDDGAGEPYSLTPEEFIHFKFYNPLQPFRGLSPVTAIRYSIQIDQLAQVWSRLFFKNSARPDFAVIAPEGITKTEKDEMLAKLRQDHSGVNAHEPIILESGVTDIKTFSFSAKDIEWLNQREMSRDEVAAIIGVPDELMGYGRDTYENFDTADRILWTLTIVPLVQMRDGSLTRFFRKIGMLQKNENIVTDLRQVPQLQEDRSSKITQAKTLFDMGIPVNMVSEYLQMGLETIPGGDTGYLSATLVPVGSISEPAALITETTKTPVVKAPPHTEYGSVEHETIWKGLQARLDTHVAVLQRQVKKEFQRQQNEIGQKLRDGKAWGRGRYKDGESVPSPNDLFDMQAEIKKFIESFKKSVQDAVLDIGQREITNLGLSFVFDLSRPTVVAAIRQILETVSNKTNETTWNDLVSLFQQAEENGEGIPAIQERLSQYFGDRKSDYQTERIARTTMTASSNAGEQEAWNQAEENGIQMDKEWISALQAGRTRQAHWEAHGQRVGLHEAFEVDGESLMHPGDPNGSPGNIINCLCGMIAIVKE